MAARLPRLTLKSGRDRSLRAFHPWVFSGAIARVEPSPLEEGAIVEVFSAQDEFLATGFFSSSDIAVKVLSFRKIEPGRTFWDERIAAAISLRTELKLYDPPVTTACRLVNAEGDLMPGLVADRYGDCIVVQFHSIGMWRCRAEIARALTAATGAGAVYSKSSSTLKHGDWDVAGPLDQYLAGEGTGSATVTENSLHFEVDWERGQKTGFYIDQRENRSLVGQHAHGKKMLNVFCYTGAFSVYGLAGGAAEVLSVDASEAAITGARRNIALNDLSHGHWELVADAFDFLAHCDEKFDLIVLDPPPFVKSRSALAGALKGYRAINYHAIKLLRPGGLLFTFSCSQLASRDLFREQVSRAGVQAGRALTIVRELSAAPCHPVSVHHPEGEYLKGLMLRVQ